MGAIIPAILPQSREDLAEKLLRLQGLVDEVQIDIVDGTVGGHAAWPYTHGHVTIEDDQIMPYLGNLRFEADLLVGNPEELLGTWIRTGATRVTVHAETTHALPQVVRDIRTRYGYAKDFVPGLLSFGLALNIGTDSSLIEPYLDQCDYVQFMGIAHTGRQGEPFDPRSLQMISAFHKKYPDMLIQADGGVSLTTAPALLQAGVSRLIVGSALWKRPDLKVAIDEFHTLLEEYGLDW
jgi:ribulose-phosphate 3-epimerase